MIFGSIFRNFLFLLLELVNVIIMSIFRKTPKVHYDNADIIFVDPCYFVKNDEVWREYCEDFSVNKSLDKLGCSQGLCFAIGDVYKNLLVCDDGTEIGALCSDSYLLGCFRLDEVLNYNPNYAQDMEQCPSSFIVIKGFTGDVFFETNREHINNESLPMITIIGKGSKNFKSVFGE